MDGFLQVWIFVGLKWERGFVEAHVVVGIEPQVAGLLGYAILHFEVVISVAVLIRQPLHDDDRAAASGEEHIFFRDRNDKHGRLHAGSVA